MDERVPTDPNMIVTDPRLAERVISGPKMIVTDTRLAERVISGPNMIVTGLRMAEKVCMGTKKAAMGPRVARMVATCLISTSPDTSRCQRMVPARSMSSVQSPYPVEVAYSYSYCQEGEKLLHSNPNAEC